jgi:arylsulfatase A-like enzyme
MKRPNILLITSDQHRGDCYGFEGRKIKTPHLDEMARDGTRFSACITPNVVCQPSRASILTGLLPLTHGVHDNGIDLRPEVGERGVASALGKSGYDTAFIGKAHFATYHTFEATGTPECLKSAKNYQEDWCGPYMGFEHVELMMIGHNWFLPPNPPNGHHYERWFYADGKGDEKNRLYGIRLDPQTTGAQTWHSALPQAWHNSEWTGNQTIDYLKRRTKDDKPFFLWASFPDPHHPFDAPEPWSRLHHPDEVDLPLHRSRDLDKRPWWHRASIENEPTGPTNFVNWRKNYSRIPPQSDQQLREIIANYYGMISLIDHEVGRILIALQESGLDEDTIVIFSTDHGELLGDHGLMLKGPTHYEGLLRVGLIAKGPGIPKNRVVNEPVSTLDLPPTFLEFASASALETMHGKSLKKLLDGEPDSRDYAYNEWELLPGRVGVQLSLRTVRTKTHKLTVELNSGEGELYDLVNDPHELENRFNVLGSKVVQSQLFEMISSRPKDAGPLQTPSGTA